MEDNKANNPKEKDFLEKINLIINTSDYIIENKDKKIQEDRLNAINELNEMLLDNNLVSQLFISNITFIFEMIKENIFFVKDKNNNNKEQYWKNLKGIYTIFLNLIKNESCDHMVLYDYINLDFIVDIIKLFNSDESEEREILMRIVHQLYFKLIKRRKKIRAQIQNYFNLFIEKKLLLNGVSELLEIISSICSGFQVPIRAEHVDFFKKYIIPLHNVSLFNFDVYFGSLSKTSYIFIQKDDELMIPLLDYLIENWPFGDYQKEQFFSEELNGIFNVCNIEIIEGPYADKIFNLILKCFSESDIHVIEYTLYLFENEKFISLVKKYKEISFNILVPKINNLSHNHWHSKIKKYFNNANKILQKIDMKAFNNVIDGKMNIDQLYPQNEEDEERQIQLAIKQSEEENKLLLEKNEKIQLNNSQNIIGNYEENKNGIKNNIIINKENIILNSSIKKSLIDEIKEEFDEDFGICPITQEYMKNPVLCPSGVYYEKSAILDWLKKNKNDPFTREHLSEDMLIEDKGYQKKIIEFRKKYNK